MTLKRPLAMACVATLAAAGSATAQDASGPSRDQSSALPAGSLIIDQDRSDRHPAAPATSRPLIAPSTGEATVANAPAGRFAAVTAIRIEGSTLPPETLKAGWAPFVGRPLTQTTLQELANALTGVYAGSDIAISTVRIPAQTFQDGVVAVAVTEGLIGQVAITGDVRTKHLKLLKRYAAKLAGERPLRRRTLERYLSLIRDIPGLTVEPRIQASRLPGVSVLTLDIDRRVWKPEFAIHDRGTPRLGRVQLQASATVNSLLQQGDVTRLTVAAPTEWEPFQYVAISHSAPIGSDGLTMTASAGHITTRPKDIPLKGEATTAGLSFTYPIIRGFRENLYLTAGLDGQDSDNAVLGRTISSDHTRAARVGLSWTKAGRRGVTQAAASISQGLDILQAEAFADVTDIEFRKLNVHMSRSQQLNRQLVARLRATAQISKGLLPGSEQFVLGGDPFGRAFSNAYAVGDSGVAASAELAWLAQSLWPTALTGSELYTFADWGRATYRDRLGGAFRGASRELASAGLGARFNWRNKTVFNVEGARALEDPYPGSDAWRLTFGWRSAF